MRILMVCLGNICRSPLAEGLLKSKIQSRNLNWTIDSAGTANYHTGSPPDFRMVETAKKHGVDLSILKARQFNKNDFSDFDRIYVMDSENYRNVMKLSSNPSHQAKVFYMLDHLNPGENLAVPDPYYGHLNGFEAVFQLLNNATEQLINDLTNDK